MISSFLFNLYLYRVFVCVCLTSAVVVHHQIKLFCIDDDDDVIGIFFLLLRCYDLCHYFVCVFEMQQVFFFVICLIFDFCVIIWLNMTLMSLLFHHFFVSLILTQRNLEENNHGRTSECYDKFSLCFSKKNNIKIDKGCFFNDFSS